MESMDLKLTFLVICLILSVILFDVFQPCRIVLSDISKGINTVVILLMVVL